MSATRGWLFRVLRVPPEPRVPLGDAGPVRVFRAGRRYYQYRLVLWAARQAGTLLGIGVGLYFLNLVPEAFAWILRLAEGAAVAGFLAQLPLTLALLRLDYQMRWYIVTDRSIRVREGIATVKEKTMTFANVQNLTVKQGPLQRLLGIADLEVRTAGGGGGGGEGGKSALGESLHEAYFRGVDNPGEIRDLIRERVRLYRDAGLGDPDDARVPALSSGADEELAAAAREMLLEARALRSVAVGRT